MTERTFNLSKADTICSSAFQNALHSYNGSSSKMISKEILPRKPVLLKIFSSIQLEIDPHKIRMS